VAYKVATLERDKAFAPKFVMRDTVFRSLFGCERSTGSVRLGQMAVHGGCYVDRVSRSLVPEHAGVDVRRGAEANETLAQWVAYSSQYLLWGTLLSLSAGFLLV